MIKQQLIAIINRPRGEIFEYIVTPEKFSEWQTEVEAVTVDKEGPLAVGHVISETRTVAGVKTTTSRIVTELVPGELIRMEAAPDAIFPFKVETTLREVEGGVEVAIQYELDVGGIFAAAEKAVARQVGKNTEDGLVRLKHILESQE